MQLDTYMLTAAQLALGFTGFAGLAGVLTMKGVEPRVSLRFWIMIEFGLATMLLSLLPIVLIYLGVGVSAAYRATSVAIAVFLGLHLSAFGPAIGQLSAQGRWQVGNRLIDLVMPLLVFTTILVQALSGLGAVFTAHGGAALGVLLLLLMSGLNFVGLLAALRAQAA